MENNEEMEISQEEEKIIPIDEKKGEKKLTRIGNKNYDEVTLKRITIVRLTQVGVPPAKIKDMLGVSKSLVSK